MKILKCLLKIAAGLLILAVYTVTAVLFFSTDGRQILHESFQPDHIAYQSYDPYTLRISEGPVRWNVIGWRRYMRISVTRSRDAFPSYGHYITTDLALDSDDEPMIEWSSEGIEMTFSRGHRLFIPKSCFIGGR